jgi:hypothetical protein
MGAKSPHENLSTNEAMDGNIVYQKQMEANLGVVVQMALFDPFEIRMQQGAHAKGASTLRSIQYFEKVNLKSKLQNMFLNTAKNGFNECLT